MEKGSLIGPNAPAISIAIGVLLAACASTSAPPEPKSSRDAAEAVPAARSSGGPLMELPATLTGDLPCADCEALRYHLDIFEDGVYFLRRIYVGRSPSGIDEIGKWKMAADGRTLELHGQRKPAEFFEVRDKTTLRKLDLAGKPIESEHNYDLKRQPTFGPIEPTLRMHGTNATLENTYWKLTSLRDRPVTGADSQREPHLILHSEKKRVAGSGGCNQLMGSYTVDRDQLALGRLASTRRACAQGMDQEQDFLTALPSVRRWRITGERLDLLDDSGSVVAQFALRSMK